DLDLDLARRLQGLQALLRLEAAPCGLELGATDLQASLLLGAVECDQRRARAEGIAEPAAEPLDAPDGLRDERRFLFRHQQHPWPLRGGIPRRGDGCLARRAVRLGGRVRKEARQQRGQEEPASAGQRDATSVRPAERSSSVMATRADSTAARADPASDSGMRSGWSELAYIARSASRPVGSCSSTAQRTVPLPVVVSISGTSSSVQARASAARACLSQASPSAASAEARTASAACASRPAIRS